MRDSTTSIWQVSYTSVRMRTIRAVNFSSFDQAKRYLDGMDSKKYQAALHHIVTSSTLVNI